ncbi:MAG: U32 family peptidase [Candidatus Gastranaerophilaceae bacterium]|nr:U32 family peptidase [Candidatus Gastranaerophilaceae bacterium]
MEKELHKTELLAPAKDLLTAKKAIDCGADAVYIGASSFGARVSARNNIEDIKELVDYAHKFYVKVHVTINTILTDEELETAKNLISDLYKIGVDAIIVQDMGIINLAIKGKLPPIVLHASTQCNNRTVEKIKFLDNIGLSRIILARELSLEKIKEICSKTNKETETFIHGALCVCYSGQCYLSYSIGGRSANRGECAQPCRKKYTLTDEKNNVIAKEKYLLSMKDFNAKDYLKELVESGVKSFKVEGRLKDENYVKNVILNYRKELDKISKKTSSGEIFNDFEPDVKKSFNRGFTSYFLKKREDCYNFNTPKMQGEYIGKVETSGDGWISFDKQKILNPQDGICYFENNELSGCLINKTENKKIYLNRKIKIKKGTEIYRNTDFEFEKQLTNSKTIRKIGVYFYYEKGILTAKDEDNNKTEIKINSAEKPKNPEKMKENFEKQLQKTGESDFYVKCIEIKGEIPFIPISQINEIRRNILYSLMEERIKNYKRETQKPLQYSKYIKQTADYHENIHNKEAEEFYKNCGCQVTEKSIESQNYFDGKELMRTKHCLKYAFNLCKSPKKLFLTDEKGKRYKLDFDCKNCEMIIMN